MEINIVLYIQKERRSMENCIGLEKVLVRALSIMIIPAIYLIIKALMLGYKDEKKDVADIGKDIGDFL